MKKSEKIRIFSAREVANICGVVNQTSINWIKSGFLKAFTTPGGQYRVYSEDLFRFLKSRNMRIPQELKEFIDSEEETLLIVDDDRELNELLHSFISRKFKNFKILQAYNGFDAGRLISEENPGVIILDIDLPGIDGFNICKQIKMNKENDTVIISVSGLDKAQVEEKILKHGADLFLQKPLELSDLAEAIERLGIRKK